jgi:hypothetical protein
MAAKHARGTRYMFMAPKPYGEVPVFNGPFVDEICLGSERSPIRSQAPAPPRVEGPVFGLVPP